MTFINLVTVTLVIIIVIESVRSVTIITRLDLTRQSTDNSGILRIYSGLSIWPLCSDNITLIEATVMCRQIGIGMAKKIRKYPIPRGVRELLVAEAPKCFGYEETLNVCVKEFHVLPINKCTSQAVVGVRCVEALANLVPDIGSVENSVYVQQEPLHQLSCAIEEKCLSEDAISKYAGLSEEQLYSINDTSKQWRKLLRFSSIIKNTGDSVFEPHVSTHDWQWHSCHGHFHSMSTFAIYQIFAIGTTSIDDRNGLLLAGHKASFCLEDNVCAEGVKPFYRCSRVKTERGTQGITPGCTDTYLHNIDCQWIDVTSLPNGRYIFRLVVNPEIMVAESNYYDNGIACELYHFSYYTGLHYCHSVHIYNMW